MDSPATNTTVEQEEDDSSVLLSTGRIIPGVKGRLLQWLNSIHPDDLILFASSMGMSVDKLWALSYRPDLLPTLRQALQIEILTDGKCRVYDWSDIGKMKEEAFDAIALCTKGISRAIGKLNWPPFYDDDLAKKLRWELARRLTRPEDNILSLIIKMGKNGIRKAEREKALESTPISPPVVDPEATDEEIEKELWRYRRQCDTRTAYRLGTRKDFDAE